MIATFKSVLYSCLVMACGLQSNKANSVSLIWDPSPSQQAIGYLIYCALPDGSQKVSYDVGGATNAIVDNLVAGQTYSFYATAYDSVRNESGPSNTLNYTVPGNQTNQPPTLAPIPSQVADEGKLLQFTVTASDPDLPKQTLSFSLGNAPAGATINSTSGLFSWTPLSSQAPSSNNVTVIITDNGQPPLSSSQSFTITVREGYYLTVGTSAYGKGQASPLGSLNSQGTKYISGTTVNVTAQPMNGNRFDHWVLDGASFTQNPISFVMNGNHTITPYFAHGKTIL